MERDLDPHITKIFKILGTACKQSYSLCYKAIHRKTGETVLLKKIFDAYANLIDARITYERAMFHQEFFGHENIVQLLGIIESENKKDIYFVYEFMETSLFQAIQSNVLEEIHKRYIIYQILKALKFIHSAQLVYLGLKTSKILLNSDCSAKLQGSNFSFTVSSLEPNEPKWFDVGSTFRWYAAPEIFLGSRCCTSAADMWSVGCVLGEMIIGKPLFASTSLMNHMERVFQVIGKPTAEDIEEIQSEYIYELLEVFEGCNTQKKKSSFQAFFPGVSEITLDFLRKLLAFNPKKRLTVDDALKHKFLEEFSGIEELEKDSQKRAMINLSDDKAKTPEDYRQSLIRNRLYLTEHPAIVSEKMMHKHRDFR